MSLRVLSQRNDDYVSNSYLVVCEQTRRAGFIDCGGPVDHLLALIADEQLELERVLLTHHHVDHISGLDRILDVHPNTAVHAHPLEAAEMLGVTRPVQPGDLLAIGNEEFAALHTPGHTAGMLNYHWVAPKAGEPGAVFTGDTLFDRSVGGVRGPGHTTFADLQHSVLDVLLALPPSTVVWPGHAEPTTIGEQAEYNPFVLTWRGQLPEGSELALVAGPGQPREVGREATLVVWARDYDGGHKAQVRYADGTDDLVPGSWIVR